MVYKVVFNKGEKAIIIVANNENEAKQKAEKQFHIVVEKLEILRG